MVKQLLFVHAMGPPWAHGPCHGAPAPHVGGLRHTLRVDLPRDGANLSLHRDVWRGWSAAEAATRSASSVLVSGFSFFPSLPAIAVGGLGFVLCVFVDGWRHAFQSECLYGLLLIIL